MLNVGDPAPNFDLSSSEGSTIMLKDEISKQSMVLYLFKDGEAEAVRRDLEALKQAHPEIKKQGGVLFGMAPTKKLDELVALQKDLTLDYLLLRDDRNFCEQYGLDPEDEEDRALFLIDENSNLRMADRQPNLEVLLPQVTQALAKRPKAASRLPSSKLNRFIYRRLG